MPTLHPAYLLRNPAHKKLAWRDFLEVKERLRALSGTRLGKGLQRLPPPLHVGDNAAASIPLGQHYAGGNRIENGLRLISTP